MKAHVTLKTTIFIIVRIQDQPFDIKIMEVIVIV